MQLPEPAATLRRRLDAAIRNAVVQQSRGIAAMHPDLDLLAEQLEALVLAGGKRLRPLLVALGWQAAGHAELDGVTGPAVAVELVHGCALAHDDVIDQSATRRGRPSAHVAFAAAHAGRQWVGESERFGEAAAILLGDLALVLADELFLGADVADRDLLAAFATFTTMRVELTAGQFLDVLGAARTEVGPTDALTIAEYKSGRYSVARPLEIGALLGGAGELARGLFRVGIPLGIAFQLRDDLLGVFGLEEETGKSVSSDLTEGKRTYLVAATLEGLAERDRARFNELLGDGGASDDEIAELRFLIEQGGGRTKTEERIEALLDDAFAALERLALPDEAARTLHAVGASLVERSA